MSHAAAASNAVPSPVTFGLDEDRIGWIVFDTPNARANVFNAATQDALAGAIDAAEVSAARALVVIGAKDRIFIAGADLRWLQQLPDAAAAEAFSRRGQTLFSRLAQARVPVVCAIHGACAGGGYELALACDWRVASDHPATLVGLPETSIGTIPAWGGCVRLPRLIGVERALDHVLRGQLIDARQAQAHGLVDELTSSADLKDRAKAVALQLADAGRPGRVAPPPPPAGLFAARREATRAKTHGNLPAPLAAIEAFEQGMAVELGEALAVEARAFGRVTAGAVCKNLIHAFFLRDAAKKRSLEGWFPAASVQSPAPIHRVGVVGAGVMGSGIAHWLATRGCEVVLRDVQVEFVERARGVIQALLDDGVKRGKSTPEEAQAVFGRIRTTTEWAGFAECDLVIEAIIENVAAKQQLFSQLATIVREDALLASNTSALPITEIAGHVPKPERTLGIHFFNPVSRMPLVELILGPRTSPATAARALHFVATLGKSPVICRSSPGFVVTRVLFFYLNAAVRRWEQGVTASAIDDAMRGFGWPMGPLRLIDEVGIDVTAFIFGEMAQYFPMRFQPTTACARLLSAGLKGRKNGASRGFYRYDAGADAVANDVEARVIAGRAEAAPDPTPEADVAAELMAVMVEEARRCVAEGVVRSPDDLDFALVSGAGFPAFRGGLLRWAETSGKEKPESRNLET